MTFTTSQLRQLRAPIRPEVVKQREVEGKVLHYLEGWHIISEANRMRIPAMPPRHTDLMPPGIPG